MQCLSRALDWMRAVLFGPRTPGKHSRSVLLQEAPQAPRHRPSPDVWGARLVTARRHRRERHAAPPQALQPQVRAQWFPPAPWERTGALVRPYVAHLGEVPRSTRTGPQAGPRGHAQ